MKVYVCPAALRAAAGVALSLFALVGTASAQSVPSPWNARDIGSPALAGSTAHSSGVFTIQAAGTDIWNSSDQFHFLNQRVTGDVEIVARVDSLTNRHEWSKAAVMIRSSLDANSAHGMAVVSASRGVHFQRRTSTSASSLSTEGTPAGTAPVWLKAVRSGTTVTAYWSSNGTSWTRIGSDSISLGSSAYVGVAVTSHEPGSRTTARISNVSVTGAGAPSPAALPAGQTARDIGSPAIAGSTSYASGVYTIRGGGYDIWDTADKFHFVYQPVSGNTEIIARVASMTYSDRWAKAGVMIRESLTAESRHAMMVTTPGRGYAFQRRPETGGYSVHTSGGGGSAPVWLRLVRSGDLFEAYRSANGSSWTRVGSDTIPMGETVYVGLAVTSHNVTTATTVRVDNLRVTAAASTNRNPAVSITAPGNGASYTAPTTVNITASASDPEGRMASVDFYVGSTLVSRDSTAPYTAAWSASTAGTYSLTAVAHDADGGSSTSGAVSITVQTATNRPPTVSLATNGTSYTAPATVALTATASDPEGQLSRVEFYNGSTRLASDTSAPYSYSWSNVPAGTYTLTAIAYDAAGASATSAAVSVTVAGSTTTAPRQVVFTASSNHSTSVTNYVLKVFSASANPSTATPIATSDLGKPTPASNGDITVDRASFFSGLAAGNYQATVTAVGSGGQAQSTAVTFTR